MRTVVPLGTDVGNGKAGDAVGDADWAQTGRSNIITVNGKGVAASAINRASVVVDASDLRDIPRVFLE